MLPVTIAKYVNTKYTQICQERKNRSKQYKNASLCILNKITEVLQNSNNNFL